MYNAIYRLPQHWMSEIELKYWQQRLRLIKLAYRAKRWMNQLDAVSRDYIEPLGDWIWAPVVSGLAGAMLGAFYLIIH